LDALQEAYNNHIITLAERMGDARKEDRESLITKQVAISKVKLLDEVVKGMLLRNPAEDVKLDKDDFDRPAILVEFLTEIAKWIKPYDDGTLPSLKIRDALLKNLDKVHVTIEVLEKSQIGKSVMALSKHKKELPENKKICKHLISKWVRPIFNISSNYQAARQEEAETGGESVLPVLPQRRRLSRSSAEGSSTAGLDDTLDRAVEGETRMMYYPSKATMDFQRRPRPMEVPKPVKSKAVKEKEQIFQSVFKETRSTTKKTTSNLGLVRLPRSFDKR